MASIIGVETLQHTNGTTAATIDSSGRMVLDNIPMCQLRLTTANSQDTSNPYTTTGTPIKFDDVVLNQGSHYSTSTGKFTCPIAGIYRVESTMLVNPDTGNHTTQLYKNTTLLTQSYSTGNGNSHVMLPLSFLVEANANDTIHLELSQGELYIDSTGKYSSLNIQLIGTKA